jgi:hypothetical protein
MSSGSKTFVAAAVILVALFALSVVGLLGAHRASAPALPSRQELEKARRDWLPSQPVTASELWGCADAGAVCSCKNPCSILVSESKGLGALFKARELALGAARKTAVHFEPAADAGLPFDVELEPGNRARLPIPRQGARLTAVCSPEALCALELSASGE